MAITYKLLHDVKHEEYDAVYWRKIHALYAGMSVMRKTLTDATVRDLLFPKHLGEEDWVYKERLKRVFYIPYMGQLVDYITAALAADPIRMSEDAGAPGSPQAATATKVLNGKVNGNTFYDAFNKDCSPPGGERMSFNQLIRHQIMQALLYRRAWTMVEMPSMKEAAGDDAPRSRYEELKTIGDGCYACPVDPEDVYDWECDDDGELLWALVCRTEKKRMSLEVARNIVREEYTFYTRDDWTRYVYEYDPEKKPPVPEQAPDFTEGPFPHSFTRVPLIPFALPDGLWAGGKIESIACEHFNKRNALSWAEYRSLFQFISVKLSEPSALNPITEDADRAVNQPIGPGRVMKLAEKDTVEYVGPDAGPFAVALEDLAVLRDEMFRLLNMMAMSVDNSGAALKRSADSKQVDNQSTSVVLKDLGRRGREHGEDIFEMVACGRGEGAKQFTAQGMDQFDEVSMDSLVAEAAVLETVPIPSQTFQALYKFELARRALPGATEEQLGDIMKELQEGITAEAEIQKATTAAQQDRIDDGVLPGETPPEQKPAKGKPPSK
jgi:hypothetical protein